VNIPELSAFQIADLVKRGQISAVEVLDAILEHIHQVDGQPASLDYEDLNPEDNHKVHAFITLAEGKARSQAEKVDRRLQEGEEVGA
jgi:Asp-tRNA(Asn)/Glu-tRNA(Gln) amidotransferase A subunit family amidase